MANARNPPEMERCREAIKVRSPLHAVHELHLLQIFSQSLTQLHFAVLIFMSS